MKKLSIISMIAIAIALVNVDQAKAQEFSGGVELGLPTGSFSDAVGLGIGASLRYEKSFGSNTSWMVDGGFQSFSGKTVSGVSLGNWTMIPIQGGVKYYFDQQMKGFYASGQLGIVFLSYSNSFLGQSVSASETDLGFAPGIGYHLDKIDLGLRYQIVSAGSSINFLGIRAAYIFSSK